MLIPVDLASPAESLRSIPSFDDELFLLIPTLMGIYNSIFISINIFGMHRSFSGVGLLGQLIAVRKTSVAPSLAPSVGKGRSTLGGSSLGPGRAGPFRWRPVHCVMSLTRGRCAAGTAGASPPVELETWSEGTSAATRREPGVQSAGRPAQTSSPSFLSRHARGCRPPPGQPLPG